MPDLGILGSGSPFRDEDVTQLPDAEIIALVMEQDEEIGEAYHEATRRWGEDAMERTAQRCTSGKYDPDEVAEDVRRDPRAAATWVGVARGEIDPCDFVR